MDYWGIAWQAATVEQRKTVRRWKAGFSKDPHRNGMRGDRNQCPTCGEFFASTSAFDKHRTGPWGKADGTPSKRRCLTVQEMVDKGFLKNATDYWIRAGNPLYGDASNPGAEQATIDLN